MFECRHPACCLSACSLAFWAASLPPLYRCRHAEDSDYHHTATEESRKRGRDQSTVQKHVYRQTPRTSSREARSSLEVVRVEDSRSLLQVEDARSLSRKEREAEGELPIVLSLSSRSILSFFLCLLWVCAGSLCDKERRSACLSSSDHDEGERNGGLCLFRSSACHCRQLPCLLRRA